MLAQVAMLGANALVIAKEAWEINIHGTLVLPTSVRWGHMIHAHYLKCLEKGAKKAPFSGYFR